ncbi:MAG: SUMF1/EgtB/PvdO family nonheme iron enzyme, partial [Pseudomonadota bacterium]
PEQLEASPHTDERSDMFALGIILFELFTFKTPKRKGETVKIGHRKVSKPTAAILRKMLAFDPANRFDSPEQVSIALTDIETATQKPLASPRFIILAGAVFVSAYLAISSGLPSRVTELWQEYLPVSEETKQQQFNTAIGHVNEVNSLIRQLEQLRQKLTSRIRDISLSIAASNNRLTKTRNEDIQNEIRQQIRQAQTDRSRLLDIQSLTQQVIYEKGQLLSAKADVIKALALIDNNSFLDASDLLQPVREQLKLDLVRFGQSSVYFNTQDSLNAAEAEWRAFRQAMQLKIPERDLGKQIETAESFVDQGRLAEAIAHLEKLTQVFKNTLEADRQRVEDRRQYQVQRGRTEKLEREWLSYLRQNGLRVSETQTKEIQRLKSSQSESLAQENFKAAETSSLALSDNLTSYLSASREEIQNKISRQQAENERRKQEQLARARAEADKALAEKNLKQPTKEREEVIEQAPSDTQVKQQIKEADSLSSLQLLARFAPNLKLVQIPAGTFRMGALNRGGSSDEKPVHRVNLESFNMSRHEITFEQYDVYAELTGADRPDDEGWGRGDNPVINVSWNDATAYTAWLSEKTGLRFRLPSEAEWEYAARAGSSSKFPWGDDTTHENANYGKEICCGGEASGRDQWVNTSPVGAFPENNFGLQDMHGNVSEWVQDCRSDSYNGAPQDGSAFEFGDCDWRMLRGGSWSSIADYLRSANRDSNRIVKRNNSLGFRILQEL